MRPTLIWIAVVASMLTVENSFAQSKSVGNSRFAVANETGRTMFVYHRIAGTKQWKTPVRVAPKRSAILTVPFGQNLDIVIQQFDGPSHVLEFGRKNLDVSEIVRTYEAGEKMPLKLWRSMRYIGDNRWVYETSVSAEGRQVPLNVKPGEAEIVMEQLIGHGPVQPVPK